MFGIGLRPAHYPHLEKRPDTQLDWFEAISENYMDTHGRPLKMLELIRRDYPVALHGVGLSIASSEAVNFAYLQKLKKLIERIEPFIVSDHLCWTGTVSHQIHDLLPFPFTQDSFKLVSSKICQVQDYLGRSILIENVSSYLQFKNSEYKEWEFLADLAKKTGCQLLLDINNVYVNAINHKFDPQVFINTICPKSVGQIHLAGHTDTGTFLFDTHSKPVCSEVWTLYSQVIDHLDTPIPTLIEWDGDVPSFERVEEEAIKARRIWTAKNARIVDTEISRAVFSGNSLQQEIFVPS